ncbi:MAG: ABC transporter substrate-binding protein, partial [Turicibacter sp.]
LQADIATIDFRNPDAEAIIALEPDIIIASGHNKAGNEDPFALLKEAGITVVYIPSSASIEGIYEDITFMAEVTDKVSEGKKMIDDMKKEVAAIKAIGDTITDQKTVYFEIGSSSSLFSFGHSTFLNELITTVGAQNILGNEEGWISPSEEAIISANPDVILTNESYLENPEELIATREGFETIKAVENGDIYVIDKNSASRGSQHVIKALKEIAQAVYPEYYAE